MADPASRPLTRTQISEFIPNVRSIISFENLQSSAISATNALARAGFVLTAPDPSVGAARILTGDGDVTVTDGGAGEDITLGLGDTGIVNGTYGSAAQTVQFTVDAKGRLIGGATFTLNTTNITEGAKLFFTNARARAAVSGSAGITYTIGTGVFTLDQSFTRGLFSSGSGINYNAGTGAIATTGFTGTGSYTNFTIVDGIIVAAS